MARMFDMNGPLSPPERLLILRLDRIGDVVLSTPVLRAARTAWPGAFIAMMVRSACRDVVDGHPDLNAAIVYDKEGAHKSALSTLGFAWGLRRYRFDTALVLHPSNRAHWIPWLAGIPRRIGYDRKQPWLLTHRIPHDKHEGQKHESEYALDMLRIFGIEPGTPQPFVAVDPAAKARIDQLLRTAHIGSGARLVAVHPSASCVSKRWAPERFAQVADQLTAKNGISICLIAGPQDRSFAQAVERCMQQRVSNLAGQLSVRESAALLARCRLLISNDSGPVHLAAAVGTPVVDIFGRNQAGLSPKRWGALGQGHVVLHKEVGCEVCLAHNCQIAFKCLTELSVQEVYAAAVGVLHPTGPMATEG
jgi:heptosyltransferase-2